jgi:hypothetical protein
MVVAGGGSAPRNTCPRRTLPRHRSINLERLPIMNRTFNALVHRAALVAALLFLPLAVQAQAPMGPPPPGLPPLTMVLLDDVLHAKLGLSAGQEALWIVLDTDEANLDAQLRASHEAVRTLVAAEMAKAVPDLLLLETARAAARDADAAAAKKLDADTLALYTNLGASQQAIVIEAIKAAYAQAQSRGQPRSGPPPARH